MPSPEARRHKDAETIHHHYRATRISK
jgi:hypothetical protein